MKLIKTCMTCKKTYTVFVMTSAGNAKFHTEGICEECSKAKEKQYRKDNATRISLKQKENNIKHAKENKIRNALYRQKNKEEIHTKHMQREASKLLLPNSFTTKQWNGVKKHFNNECAYCGKTLPLQQEHFLALSKGGEYTTNNIVCACSRCNSSKNNRDFFTWYPKQKYYSKGREIKILKRYLIINVLIVVKKNH